MKLAVEKIIKWDNKIKKDTIGPKALKKDEKDCAVPLINPCLSRS